MAQIGKWVMDMQSSVEEAVYSGAKTVEDVLNYVKNNLEVVDERYVRDYAKTMFEFVADQREIA